MDDGDSTNNPGILDGGWWFYNNNNINNNSITYIYIYIYYIYIYMCVCVCVCSKYCICCMAFSYNRKGLYVGDIFLVIASKTIRAILICAGIKYNIWEIGFIVLECFHEPIWENITPLVENASEYILNHSPIILKRSAFDVSNLL